jgi:hypothetical protein
MSAKFAKGDRVAIVGGKQGQGMRGEVFWIGESRFGKGARYGIRGDDAETYWIDEQQVGAETDVPAPALPEPGEPMAKGTRVQITRGEAAGTLGEIFWVGENKFGRGPRYGVRDDEGQTHWVDGPSCEASDAPAPPRAEAPAKARDERRDEPNEFDDAPASARAPEFDDAPLPSDDDLAFPEAGDDEPPF